MKRLIISGLVMILLFSGCASNANEGGSGMKNTDKVDYSDGVIAPMSAEELIQKLAQLNEKTTWEDMVNIFGKEPRMVTEISVNGWEYFSGNITIYLADISPLEGNNLFQVIVSTGDSSIAMDLRTFEEQMQNPE